MPRTRSSLGGAAASSTTPTRSASKRKRAAGNAGSGSDILSQIQEDLTRFLGSDTENEAEDDRESDMENKATDSNTDILAALSRENESLRRQIATLKSGAASAPASKRARTDTDMSELLRTKQENGKLEAKLRQQKVDMETASIAHELEINKMKGLVQTEKARAEELESHRRFLAESETDLKAKVQELSDKLSAVHKTHQQETSTLNASHHSKVTQLESELDSVRSQCDEVRAELRRAQLQTAPVKELEAELAAATPQKAKADAALTQLRADLLDAQQQLLQAQDELRVVKAERHSDSESQALIATLQAEVARYANDDKAFKAAQAENRQLKERAQNAERLTEELEAAVAAAKRADTAKLESVTKLEEMNTQLAELEGWKTAFAHYKGATEAERAMKSLQDEVLLLQSSKSTAAAEAVTKGNTVSELESQIAKLGTDLSAAKEAQVAAEDREKAASRKVMFLTKERDGLKMILDSYNDAEAVGDADHSQPRVAKLERELDEARSQLRTLEGEVASATPTRAKQSATMDQLRRDLEHQTGLATRQQGYVAELTTQLEKLKTSHEKEVRDYINEIAVLQQRVGKGEFNRQTTKVLHLAHNPQRMASASVAQERDRLLAKVNDLEARLAKAGDGGKADGADEAAEKAKLVDSEKVLALKRNIADLERLNQRLKEIFKAKIQEFRTACYDLTGWKMDMLDKQYRLMSMYAEGEADMLLFARTEDGSLQLMDTEYCSQLDTEVRTFLATCDSIPGFLASLTLKLFDKKTFMPKKKR